MTIDREDYRFTTADQLYDAIIAAQVSAPSGTTDAANNVAITASGKKGTRYVNFLGLVRNAADDGEGAADVWLFPFFYIAALSKWIPANGIKFHRQAQILADTNGVKGNAYQVVKPSGATRVGWATSDSFGGDTTLHLAVQRDT